jgi:hypothetical protein
MNAHSLITIFCSSSSCVQLLIIHGNSDLHLQGVLQLIVSFKDHQWRKKENDKENDKRKRKTKRKDCVQRRELFHLPTFCHLEKNTMIKDDDDLLLPQHNTNNTNNTSNTQTTQTTQSTHRIRCSQSSALQWATERSERHAC